MKYPKVKNELILIRIILITPKTVGMKVTLNYPRSVKRIANEYRQENENEPTQYKTIQIMRFFPSRPNMYPMPGIIHGNDQ